MGKVIIVVSGKGGVGKTSVVANIGVALTGLNKDVILVDNDLGLRNLDLALGVENKVFYDIADIIEEECKLKEAVVKDEKYNSLALIPATQFKDDFVVGSDKYFELIKKLKRRYDFVLIDCPAGIGDNFKNAANVADMALIVANPDPYSLRDADKIATLLDKYENITDIRLVVNKMRPKLVKNGIMPTVNDIIEALGIRIIGLICEDDAVVEASIKGYPIVLDKKSKTGREFTNIAKRLCGQNIPILEIGIKKLFRTRK